MNASSPRAPLLCVLALLGASGLGAQSAPDLVPPKLREKVVSDAQQIVRAREESNTLPTPLPNPFIAKEPETGSEPESAAMAVPSLGGAELLARLAARIPSTGTVSIGGAPLLLLGQKRLKVGDLYPISFEGQTYEVSIEAVSSTTFTVRRGDHIHTRPVRLPTSSATPTTNRP